MEYSIRQLADMAGITGRTLRHYHQIGLLPPLRTGATGIRFYGPRQVERLQQILLYRRMGMPLADIRALLDDPGFDRLAALRQHRDALESQRRELDTLIATVDKSIAAEEGRTDMTDEQRFEGLKQSLLDQNEARYGDQLRERYGPQAVEDSNRRFLSLSQGQYRQAKALEQQVLDALDAAFPGADPAGEEAQALAALHREWLAFYWPAYNPVAHAGLAQTYVEDERFALYYDRGVPGKAAFLRDAILHYTKSL